VDWLLLASGLYGGFAVFKISTGTGESLPALAYVLDSEKSQAGVIKTLVLVSATTPKRVQVVPILANATYGVRQCIKAKDVPAWLERIKKGSLIQSKADLIDKSDRRQPAIGDYTLLMCKDPAKLSASKLAMLNQRSDISIKPFENRQRLEKLYQLERRVEARHA
jgi:hypothetical protein